MEGMIGEANDRHFHDRIRVDDHGMFSGGKVALLAGTRENLKQDGQFRWLVRESIYYEFKSFRSVDILCNIEGYVERLVRWARTGETWVGKRDFPRGRLLSVSERKHSHTHIILKQCGAAGCLGGRSRIVIISSLIVEDSMGGVGVNYKMS